MDSATIKRWFGVAALVVFAAIVIFAQDRKHAVTSLKDFSDVEVRGAGLTLDRDLTVHIHAVGGGDRSLLREWIDDDNSGMYAYGWIIDAATRELVWEMSRENTSGRRDDRVADEDLKLAKGAYEIYFAAYGYIRSGTFSYSETNIDRREPDRRGRRSINIFGDDARDLRDAFMEHAKDDWGITVSVSDNDAGAVRPFEAPAPFRQTLLSVTRVGDNATIRKTLVVKKDVPVRIYALGESRGRDEMYDYGWLVNAETRERVWDMSRDRPERAGGSRKNILSDVDLNIRKGTYELVYVTDGNHSADDWNDRPPYDPFSYGITVFLKNEADRGSVSVSDGGPGWKNLIVEITRVRDDEFRSMAFSLAKEMKVHIYALGERSGDRRLSDYGWIVNARTREKVWSMEDAVTEHAGGASKNRLVDEVITLPKGDYVVYYQTDDSHAYDEWNSSAPYDAERWGITLTGVGTDFNPANVKTGKEPPEEGVLAQIVRVRDDRHERQSFTLDRSQRVRVYAVGEGVDEEMADYGWIEDARSGRTVWEMTYGMTERAGGARKNRQVSVTFTLEKGEYVLHYRTDGSHAFNEWNDDPPDDREHWGITVYREE